MTGDHDYLPAAAVTRLRIFKAHTVEQGDYPWWVDGTDDSGMYCSEACVTVATFSEAVEHLPIMAARLREAAGVSL